MWQRISDLTTGHAHHAFVGRNSELDALRTVLSVDGPHVVHVHGIAGIGKTALLEMFAAEARGRGTTVIRLDCRNVEPTQPGFLQALGGAIGGGDPGTDRLVDRLAGLGSLVVLALDTYEVFRLLDAWLRQTFVPVLPDNVRILFFSRQRLLDAWLTAPGWGRVRCLHVPPLSQSEAKTLLTVHGMEEEDAVSLARATHGHPLALKLAAAASRENHFRSWPQEIMLQHAVDELSRLFLADVDEPVTRCVLEGAVVIRRVTVSLLQAISATCTPGCLRAVAPVTVR